MTDDALRPGCPHNESGLDADIEPVVEALCDDRLRLMRDARRIPCTEPLPSRDEIIGIVEDLRSVIFPGYFGDSEVTAGSLRYDIGNRLARVHRRLVRQIRRCLCFDCRGTGVRADCALIAQRSAATFLAALPEIRRLAILDVHAAGEGDPAAVSPDEVIFCYPGLVAVTSYRLAHALHSLEIPLLPRIITEHAHSLTGIDIHPGATIDESFFIDHGTGVVVGETCRIGKRVRLYQGVTLGAKSIARAEDGSPMKGLARHPIIEDDVVIYARATILGRVTIGAGSVIGGNVWLTRSVPARTFIVQPVPRQEAIVGGEPR